MEKNMNVNFEWLERRILDTNDLSNLDQIKVTLQKIQDNVICIGSGGSHVVSEYACKVFNLKNNYITINREPRDLLYEKLDNYKNILVCSYSGNNYGVEVSFDNNLNKYLLTNGDINRNNISLIRYLNSINQERSFISLAATLMPMSILLNYYLETKEIEELIKEMFSNIDTFSFNNNCTFEVMSGLDTSVASTYLESTMVEAGLANPIIHHKYEYCHGRTTLPYNNSHSLVYLSNNIKDIDNVILDEASKLYKEIIVLKSNYNNIIIDNFNLTLKAMYLTKYLAELQNKDLSDVKYAPAVKRLYRFRGEM